MSTSRLSDGASSRTIRPLYHRLSFAKIAEPLPRRGSRPRRDPARVVRAGCRRRGWRRSSRRSRRSRTSPASWSCAFSEHRFEEPKNSQDECKEKDMTYAAPLFVTAEFLNRGTGELKQQTVFMGDFPVMTDGGTFIINGTERIVVSQLVRSPGVYFDTVDRQGHRPRPVRLQDHPVARRVAGVRGRQARLRRRPRRPQAQAAHHRAVPRAQGHRLRRGGRGVRAGRPRDARRARSPTRRSSRSSTTTSASRRRWRRTRCSRRRMPCMDIYRKLRPGEPPTAGERRRAAHQPVLQLQALRPGQGRPLQGQQEDGRGARPSRPAHRRRGQAAARRADGARAHRGRGQERRRPSAASRFHVGEGHAPSLLVDPDQGGRAGDDELPAQAGAAARTATTPTTSTTSATVACAASAS